MAHLRTHRPLVLAVLVVGFFVLPGCRQAGGADAQPGSDRFGHGHPGLDTGAAGVGGSEPRSDAATADAGAGVPLPADFPGDVHLPPRSRVDSAMDMQGLKMVNVTTPMALAQVSADVEQAMTARGWTREMAMQEGEGRTLVYSKDRRQAVYQMLGRDHGGTRLAVRTGAGG